MLELNFSYQETLKNFVFLVDMIECPQYPLKYCLHIKCTNLRELNEIFKTLLFCSYIFNILLKYNCHSLSLYN